MPPPWPYAYQSEAKRTEISLPISTNFTVHEIMGMIISVAGFSPGSSAGSSARSSASFTATARVRSRMWTQGGGSSRAAVADHLNLELEPSNYKVNGKPKQIEKYRRGWARSRRG